MVGLGRNEWEVGKEKGMGMNSCAARYVNDVWFICTAYMLVVVYGSINTRCSIYTLLCWYLMIWMRALTELVQERMYANP